MEERRPFHPPAPPLPPPNSSPAADYDEFVRSPSLFPSRRTSLEHEIAGLIRVLVEGAQARASQHGREWLRVPPRPNATRVGRAYDAAPQRALGQTQRCEVRGALGALGEVEGSPEVKRGEEQQVEGDADL